jgi:hypothetical protein
VEAVRLLRFSRARSIAEDNENVKRSNLVNEAVTRLTAYSRRQALAEVPSPEDRLRVNLQASGRVLPSVISVPASLDPSRAQIFLS